MIETGSGTQRPWAVAGGVILVGLGALFFLDRHDQLRGGFWKLWPFVMVAIAAVKLANARGWPERRSALWLMMVGGWMLLNTLDLFGLSWGTSWPLLVIAMGILLVMDALGRRSSSGEGEGNEERQPR